MNDTEILANLTLEIQKSVPKFKVKSKQDSKFLKFLNFFVKSFNPGFMTAYVTTIYPNVYFPDNFNDRTKWQILAHEWVHLLSARSSRLGFSLGYLFPQWLAIFSVFSFLAIWFSNFWLLNLLWLLLAAPLPAYFRMKEEFDGYTMSMAVNWWRTGFISPTYIAWVAEQFTGPGYYFMWPFKRNIKNRLNKRAAHIRTGIYDDLYPYNKVKSLIK